MHAVFVGQNSLVEATFNAKTAVSDTVALGGIMAQTVSKAEALALEFRFILRHLC